MTATKTTDRGIDIQILEETVRGHFAGKNAMMDSILVTQGAVVVNSQMPHGRESLDNEITVPYFGTIGEFEDNPEDQAVVPKVIKGTNEKATLGRSSLAFETTTWARNSGPQDVDLYDEGSVQIAAAAKRKMDSLCVGAAAGTPLQLDAFNASGSPSYLDWDMMADGQALLGDEDGDIVAMVTHSRVKADLRKLLDANGRSLLVDSMKEGEVARFQGIPLIISDRAALTGSSMGSVTEAGASVGNVALTGTPTGPWDLQIDIQTGGSRGTATFKFSTDGGNTWSAELTTAASVELIDTAADSLVGQNGKTGLTATFGVATYNSASVYSAKAILKVSSLILQKGAIAFWYSAANMGLETDKDILKHNDVAAMHMYRAVHRYRRRRGGSRPGVVALRHNVRNFDGT
jgi:hypothetical protein